MLAWAGTLEMATSAYHLAVTPHGLKIGPSRYGGSPGGEKYWRVAGSCKPHLLGLTLLRACTCAKPSYLYKMPASTSPFLTSGRLLH